MSSPSVSFVGLLGASTYPGMPIDWVSRSRPFCAYSALKVANKNNYYNYTNTILMLRLPHMIKWPLIVMDTDPQKCNSDLIHEFVHTQASSHTQTINTDTDTRETGQWWWCTSYFLQLNCTFPWKQQITSKLLFIDILLLLYYFHAVRPSMQRQLAVAMVQSHGSLARRD